MRILEQDKDYNCGEFALYFLLQINGYDNVNGIEFLSNEKTGTSHNDINKWLIQEKIDFEYQYDSDIKNIKTPAIINYQYCDDDGCDGHYGVVISIIKDNVVLYNPAIGKIEILDVDYFEDMFYSERYGKGWALWIL